MKDNLVSVIITTHNRKPQIVLRAVNSVLRQTYKNIELIVVDDSTSDYPYRGEVKQSVCDISDSILYIDHGSCKGSCAARNNGLDKAHGEYVAFLDDDDEWLPTKIEEQLKGFINDKIALVYSRCIIVDEVNGHTYLQKKKLIRGYVFKSLLMTNFLGGTSVPLIRRSCIDKVGGFDTKYKSMQDYDLWLRIAKRYPVNYINKPLTKYYIHSNERISNNWDNKLSGRLRLLNKYHKYIEQDDSIWYALHRNLVIVYIKKGWKKKAFLLWLKCVKKCPLQLYKNFKQLTLIVLGYDSMIYRIYRKIFIKY